MSTMIESDKARVENHDMLFGKEALQLIADERNRQLELGYTAEHDDRLTDGSLADAAACFAAGSTHLQDRPQGAARALWPQSWEQELLTGSNRQKRLVIAAALLAAEIERELRAQSRKLGEGKPVLDILVV